MIGERLVIAIANVIGERLVMMIANVISEQIVIAIANVFGRNNGRGCAWLCKAVQGCVGHSGTCVKVVWVASHVILRVAVM